MDDIWASYYVESLGFKVVYSEASVYQDRNEHDLIELSIVNVYKNFRKIQSEF